MCCKRIQMESIPPELVRMVVLSVGCPKDYGRLLRTNTIFRKSITKKDTKSMLKKFIVRKKLTYPNGKLHEEYGVLPNEARHGPSTQYFDDGMLCYQGRYRRGEKHGCWKFWWGFRSCSFIRKHINGYMWRKVRYHRGKLHGKHKEYDYQGNKILVSNYKNGILVEQSSRLHSKSI
jgi:antitoxin component YwqK of YwqJK toxin-antitoxin module